MRLASEKDLPEIVAIYNSTVATRLATADTAAVTVESRRQWFAAHTADRRPIWVHEIDGTVAAWVSLSDFYGRPAYALTAEISLYIASPHRGRGLGRRLLTDAMERAAGVGIKTLLAFIFAHNLPSIRVFESAGFERWGTLPDIAEMDGREYSLSIYGRRVGVS